MKKIIIALLISLAFVTSSFAASSEDIHKNLYLRQDVFEAKMDAFMAEIKIMNQNMRSEFKQEVQNMRLEFKQDIHELSKAIAVLSERTDRNFETLSARIDRLDSRIDGTNTRIDDLRNGLYLWLVVIGTFIAWPKAKNFLQQRSANKQSFSLDDVERLIDSKLNSKTQ